MEKENILLEVEKCSNDACLICIAEKNIIEFLLSKIKINHYYCVSYCKTWYLTNEKNV